MFMTDERPETLGLLELECFEPLDCVREDSQSWRRCKTDRNDWESYTYSAENVPYPTDGTYHPWYLPFRPLADLLLGTRRYASRGDAFGPFMARVPEQHHSRAEDAISTGLIVSERMADMMACAAGFTPFDVWGQQWLDLPIQAQAIYELLGLTKSQYRDLYARLRKGMNPPSWYDKAVLGLPPPQVASGSRFGYYPGPQTRAWIERFEALRAQDQALEELTGWLWGAQPEPPARKQTKAKRVPKDHPLNRLVVWTWPSGEQELAA